MLPAAITAWSEEYPDDVGKSAIFNYVILLSEEFVKLENHTAHIACACSLSRVQIFLLMRQGDVCATFGGPTEIWPHRRG